MFRILIGSVGILLLLVGGWLWQSPADSLPELHGVLIRIGLLLSVIWLAYPQLESVKGRIPWILLGIVLICLVIAAAKPKIGSIVFGIAMLAVSAGGILRWMSKAAGHSPDQKRKRPVGNRDVR